jgi:hypothetical protein
MTDTELEEPDYVDFVGVVMSKNSREKYDVYRVSIVDGAISLSEVKFGRDRLKKSAVKVMSLDLVGISQAITKGQIEFVLDKEDGD